MYYGYEWEAATNYDKLFHLWQAAQGIRMGVPAKHASIALRSLR